MSKRKITFFQSQTSKRESVEVEIGATWGEIKAAFAGRMSISDKTLVLAGSKLVVDYGVDSAVIPGDNDLTVFVYPKESKGGMGKKPESKKSRPSAKKKAGKKPVKKAKKVANKTKKPAKKVKKVSRPSRKKVVKKPTVSSVVSSVANKAAEKEKANLHDLEQKRIAEENALQNESRAISREFGFKSR